MINYLKLTEQDIEAQETVYRIATEVIQQLPEGRLNCKIMNNRCYYYWVDAVNKQHYIRKKDRDLVHLLKYKKLLQLTIDVIRKNLKIQNRILKTYKEYTPASLYELLPNTYRDMPVSFYTSEFLPSDAEAEDDDEKFIAEGLKQKTSFGLSVRSKSEALIAELLHAASIPFEYEKKVVIRDANNKKVKYRPDFTFTLPSGLKIYWEHVGLLHDEDYRKRTMKKFMDYYLNEIIMPDSLILTMETADGAIDIAAIDRVIKGQLLPFFQ